ncbi:hypothetical protein BDQ17DRAFT_1261075 [Cyathus striatus]|nr:hypothetical protein BDQ17DRAFT_1261075 [Cyathus striatus]
MRFNTRLYSAPLLRGDEPVVGTTTKCGFEAWVHGRNVKPVRCELQGAKNETWGIWAVDYDEPSCATWWSPPKDTGCTADGSGYRRYEAKLENVEWGASWEDMCKSTPVTFNKRTFNSPNHCINRGILGMYGAWTVEDTECH